MGRKQAREAAVKTLYQVDVGGVDPEKAIENVALMDKIAPGDMDFVRDLVLGSIMHLADIDAIIAALSKDWNVDRMPRVDCNIMRMAIFELLYRDDIPAGVTVNEAVNLAKTYGSELSGKFVNGILGRVVREYAPNEPAENSIKKNSSAVEGRIDQ
ncbi:MAG: transcription antitermination factor NusB [Bacillota bacterium]